MNGADDSDDERRTFAEALRLSFSQDISARLFDSTYTLPETLNFIIERLQTQLEVDHVDILFEYADGLRIEYSSDPIERGRPVPIEHSISGLALDGPNPVVENDILLNSELSSRYLWRREHSSQRSHGNGPPRSFAAARIMLDEHAIGAINVESDRPDAFTSPAQVELVTTAAAQVSLALSHAALFDEDALRAKTDELLVADTSTDNDFIVQRVLGDILRVMRSLVLINAEHVEILFPDPDDPRVLMVAHSTNEAAIGLRVRVNESVCGEAFRTRNTIVLQRAYDRPEYKPLQDGMICEMAIPIQLGGSERFSIGVLNIESDHENAFPRAAQVVAERFARRVVTLVALAKLRSDFQNAVQDEFLVLAADQVLNAVHRLNNHVGAARADALDLLDELESADPAGLDIEDIRARLRSIADETSLGLGIPDELRRRIVAPPESIDVNDQVRAGIGAVRLPRTIRVTSHLEDSLPAVPCTALDLAVENLLLNAIAAMSETGGDIRLATSLDDRGESERFVVVTISDTGRGMTEAQVARLFEPRRDTRRRGRGLGFGMVWVKAWVRRAHGLIRVDSAVGRGTTVTITFQVDAPTGNGPKTQSEESA